jgi:hypothetical protein
MNTENPNSAAPEPTVSAPVSPPAPPLNYPVDRLPVDLPDMVVELDEVFNFPGTLTAEQEAQCKEIESVCHVAAVIIGFHLPEGKEHTVAVNNILAAALWARYGIARRQPVILAAGAPKQITVPEQPPSTTDSLQQASAGFRTAAARAFAAMEKLSNSRTSVVPTAEVRQLVEKLRDAVMYDPYTEDERCVTGVADLPLVREAERLLDKLAQVELAETPF